MALLFHSLKLRYTKGIFHFRRNLQIKLQPILHPLQFHYSSDPSLSYLVRCLNNWYVLHEILKTMCLLKSNQLKTIFMAQTLKKLWPCDAIWRHRSMSILAQVMACCLMPPSHYLDQCWLMVSEVLWQSPDSNFTENTKDIYLWNEFEIYSFETVVKTPGANDRQFVPYNMHTTLLSFACLCTVDSCNIFTYILQGYFIGIAFQCSCLNPSCVGTELICFNKENIMVIYALAPCITRPSWYWL